MAGGDDTATVEIEAPRSTVVYGVAKEGAWCRSCSEFVRSGSCLIGETQTSESTKVAVGWGCAEQKLKWGDVAGSVTRAAIHEVSGRV